MRFLSLLLPSACCACGRRAPSDRGLCRACFGTAEYTLPGEVAARTRLPDAVWLDAALRLEPGGPVQRLHHAFKFGGRPALAQPLAELMCRAYLARRGPNVAWIAPVPLHSARRAQRGYNQAAELAHALGARLDRPSIPDLLVRERVTRPQSGLGRLARAANVAGAFRADGEPPPGPGLLVDDVLTTGATLAAALAALHRAGAGSVAAYAAAFAVG